MLADPSSMLHLYLAALWLCYRLVVVMTNGAAQLLSLIVLDAYVEHGS
jgi:hypothetical protein